MKSHTSEQMRIEEKLTNDGEMCLKCNHARKFHWTITPYAESAKNNGDYKTECQYGFVIGRCIQNNICGCVRDKNDFAIVR